MSSRSKWDVILPKKLDVKIFDDEFEKASREIEAAVKEDFEEKVRFWKKVPQFRGYVRLSGNRIYISVGTADKIFGYVDEGTDPHIIKPVNAKFLHWVDPNTGEDRFAKEVHHPGFEGKHWTDEIRKTWEGGLMEQYYEDAMVTAINKSGHALK